MTQRHQVEKNSIRRATGVKTGLVACEEATATRPSPLGCLPPAVRLACEMGLTAATAEGRVGRSHFVGIGQIDALSQRPSGTDHERSLPIIHRLRGPQGHQESCDDSGTGRFEMLEQNCFDHIDRSVST